MDPEAAAFSVALYEEGRSVTFGPAINLMVEWKSGGAIVVTLPSLPPSLARANYDCWFLLVSRGLVWSRRRIVAQTRHDSATMAINEEGRK